MERNDAIQWLAGGTRGGANRDLDELLEYFREVFGGVVVWDERVPSTSNLASSIAGCDDLLALRFDPSEGSLYRQLTSGAWTADQSSLAPGRRRPCLPEQE